MNINWFPGHMAKALRMIDENIKLVDLVIYVLDSRAPFSCFNPTLSGLFSGKKIIYALNKADLVPVSHLNEWKDILSSEKSVALCVDSTASNSASPIVKAAKNLCNEKLEKYKLKGVKTTIRAMVAGVPNSGKSTLINNLCSSGKTMTGNRPGVTKGKQWVKVNDYFEVLDTPGTLYPKLSDQVIAKHLAYIGSIKDEVTEKVELALSFIEEINALYPAALFERYKTEYVETPLKTLEQIARNRGFLLKGADADIERAAEAVIDDFRKGRMGKLILEKAGSYADKRFI